MKGKNTNKLLSILLSICMIVTMMPVLAFGAGTDDTPEDDSYRIVALNGYNLHFGLYEALIGQSMENDPFGKATPGYALVGDTYNYQLKIDGNKQTDGVTWDLEQSTSGVVTYAAGALNNSILTFSAVKAGTVTIYAKYGGNRVRKATITVSVDIGSGNCGVGGSSSVKWKLDRNRKLTIWGTGDMQDFDKENRAPWYPCRRNINEIEVKSGVTRIGNYSFYRLTDFTKLIVASSVKFVGKYAFYDCNGLKTLKMPGIISIGSHTFCDCDSLRYINIPDTVGYMGRYAFAWCDSITNFTVPSSLTTVKDRAFYGCRNLQKVVVPNGVLHIGDYVFANCIKLNDVSMAISVGSMGNGVFYRCKSLTEFEMPMYVATPGKAMFQGCSSLENVLISSRAREIRDDTFYMCKKLKNIIIPDEVESIGVSAFYGCLNLESVSFGSSVDSIQYMAFYNCKALKSLIFPDSVQYIERYAFQNCINLVRISFGNGLREIDYRAFYNCRNLGRVALNEELNYVRENAFNRCTNLNEAYIPENVHLPGYIPDIPKSEAEDITLPGLGGGGGGGGTAGGGGAESPTSPKDLVWNNDFTSVTYKEFNVAAGKWDTKTSEADRYALVGGNDIADGTNGNFNGWILARARDNHDVSVKYLDLNYARADIPNIISYEQAVQYFGSGFYRDYYADIIFNVPSYVSNYNLGNGTNIVGQQVASLDRQKLSGMGCYCKVKFPSTYDNSRRYTDDQIFTLSVVTSFDSNQKYIGSVPSLSIKIRKDNPALRKKYYSIMEKTPGLVIKGYSGSEAEGYANYFGIRFIPVDEQKTDLSLCSAEPIANQIKTGSAIKPDVVMVDSKGWTLIEGLDYTLSYSNNVNVGTATVTVTGKGEYTGTRTFTFQIVQDANNPGTGSGTGGGTSGGSLSGGGLSSGGSGSAGGGAGGEEIQAETPKLNIAVDDSSIKTSKGGVNASLDDKQVQEIIEGIGEGTNSVEIDLPKGTNKIINSSRLQIPANVINKISNSNAELKVSTPSGNINFDMKSVEAIADKTGGKDVKINIARNTKKTDSSSSEYNVSVTYSGNKEVSKFGKGNLEITLPIPSTLKSDGGFEVLNKAGKYSYDMDAKVNILSRTATFKTTHLSKYIIANGKTANKMLTKSVAASTVKASSIKVKKGKIMLTYKNGKGNTPDAYMIYRSNQKNKGYKKIATVEEGNMAYIDSKGLKKGKKYFYKIRGCVKIGDKEAYTKFSAAKSVKLK